MVNCITVDLLSVQYDVTCQPGDVYRPAQRWWFLVTASYTHSLVQPHSLRSCFKKSADCGFGGTHFVFPHQRSLSWKTPVQKLELIITLFANFPRIRLLDDSSL